MLNIIKNLTLINYTKMTNKKNKYIVIHYVGSVSTAKNNCLYFKTVNRKASANYFVDAISIYQAVNDTDKAWHCGGGLQGKGGHSFYLKCTNSNSIGIEMCLDKPNHISDKTIENTAALVQYLMKKYSIPSSNVIRHYDVTGKLCPAMYVDENKWKELKEKLIGSKNENSSKLKVSLINKESNNSDIMILQKELNKINVSLSKLKVDGKYGSKTKDYILAVWDKWDWNKDNKSNGWTAGEKTLKKLKLI